ncbi:MAG: cysteine--tRNA ligase, partial [Thiotrichales bacterium]
MLTIYDSQTKKPVIFKSIKPGHIGIYVCGITVYDYCHIGHARTYIAFDVIVKYLRWRGYTVNYVRNITDIDDKIIKRALENKETTEALSNKFIEIMHEDLAALGISKPDIEPKATQHIQEMIDMIAVLIEKDMAYTNNVGDVYYKVNQFKNYGALSSRKLLEQLQGNRELQSSDKQAPEDFVLWKAAKPNEPYWDSPWGKGRPGWHIECSAMSKKYLGNTFDIHAGGNDLKFPHHENEIAQSEAVTCCKMANLWLHSGMVQINKEKMSKSLNNFFTIRDVLKKYDAETVRYFLLSAHYRSPINYSEDNLTLAQQALTRFYTCLRATPPADTLPTAESFSEKFITAMNNDFNTAEAISQLFELVKTINSLAKKDVSLASQHSALLKKLGNVFGILQQHPDEFLQRSNQDSPDVTHIENLIQKRNQAREAKDWAGADELRKQ